MARPSAKSRVTVNDTDIAYVAGILDSSGVIFSTARPIVQTPAERVIHFLTNRFGGESSKVYGLKKIQYAWTMNEQELNSFVQIVGPFLWRNRAKAYRFLAQQEIEPDFEPDDEPS